MDAIKRFPEYAAAFENVYKDDDWSLLEPYFTEDAVYEITGGPPFEGRHEGRDAVFAGLEQAVNSFDRRFDSRELDVIEGPELREGAVWLRWRVTYRVEGAPDLTVEGEERAVFEGDRIKLLADRFPEKEGPHTLAWFEQHNGKLHPAKS